MMYNREPELIDDQVDANPGNCIIVTTILVGLTTHTEVERRDQEKEGVVSSSPNIDISTINMKHYLNSRPTTLSITITISISIATAITCCLGVIGQPASDLKPSNNAQILHGLN